jgi:predicted Ser/Thr protein kinase
MIIHRRRESTPEGLAGLRRGDTIAGYEIERVLGTGGMGVVYEATQLSLKRRVALKVIAAAASLDGTVRERFRREGKLQAVIEHPHILPVYEAGESRGRLFIAMRLVHGPTLKAIAAARSLDQHRTVRILGDVAHALDAAHRAGLIHRDVKPQNILVDHGDFSYLADFGLTKTSDESTLTRTGQLVGSVAYMSPEQVRGERASEASDIYSFACVVYECLVGLVPFPRESDHAVLHAHVWDAPPRPSEIRPELPRALDEVIARGMAKAPSARPQSACALVRDVRSALGLEPEAAGDTEASLGDLTARDDTSTELRPARAAGARRSRRSLVAILGAIALLIGAVAGYALARDPARNSGPQTPTVESDGPGQPHAAAADARFGTDLNAAFVVLNATKARADRALAHANGAAGQAAALAALAGAYRTAGADALEAAAPSQAVAARNALGASLARVADSYRRLELAARRRDRHAYDHARSTLRRREAALGDALRQLGRLGYRFT